MQKSSENSKKNNIEELSEVQLKHLKLITEIKALKKPFYQEPGFWTLVIAITATIYSLLSGLFQTKSDIVELKSLKLEIEYAILHKRADSLNIYLLAQKDYIKSAEERISIQNDSLKRLGNDIKIEEKLINAEDEAVDKKRVQFYLESRKKQKNKNK